MLQKAGLALSDISTPKLGASDPSRLFYKYYAGFSEAFVEDTLRFLGATPGQKILDPWNGAGTTTAVAASHQLEAFGYDLNPALVAIAKARAVEPTLGQKLLEMYCAKLTRKRRVKSKLNECDPLLRWFGQQSVCTIRGVEEVLRSTTSKEDSCAAEIDLISDDLSVLYSVIFRVLRSAVSGQIGSNPTWIRHGVAERRAALSFDTFRRAFIREAGLATQYYKSRADQRTFPPPVIAAVSSTELKGLEEESIELTITSPPYCTRIDYAVATSIELAVLSKHYPQDFSILRRGLIGTTITSGFSVATSTDWGSLCNDFLARVATHPSKASSAYYLRYYTNYFAQMFSSLREITKVTKKDGYAVIVVQDSYYKQIKLNLGSVLAEMFAHFGWVLQHRRDFVVEVSFTHLNPHARLYPKESPPIESALFFMKG